MSGAWHDLKSNVRRSTPPWVRRYLLPGIGLALLIFYPQITSNIVSGSATWIQFIPEMSTMVKMVIFTIMALGLNVVVGYAGLLDLGYVAFYAAGAYIAGWFATQQFTPHNINFFAPTVPHTLEGIHISVWLLLIIAAVFAATLGILIGLPTLRLRGDYLAIVTLGFGEIIPQAVNNGDNWFGHNITNGPNGLTPIDQFGFGYTIHNAAPFLPANYGREFNLDYYYYWTALVLLGFTLFCCIRLRDSRLGRAWVAIREDEIAASAMGIPLMRTKTLAYAIGAFFGGMAGCYYAVYKSSTFPGDFSLNISIFILCMVILGGMGNVWGVMLGGFVLAYLNFQGLGAIGNQFNSSFGTNVNVGTYQYGIFGIIIVSMMLLRPQGLIPGKRRALELEVGVHDQSLFDVEHDEGPV